MSALPVRDRVRRLLAQHTTLVLATAGEDGAPWACALFYALDEDGLSPLVVSSAGSRHAANLAARPSAAAAVNAQHDEWRTIEGVQLEGPVELLAGDARARALARYLERFPWLGALDADDAAERRIREHLAAADVYRLRPERLVLVENARGFGVRQVIDASAGRVV